MEHTQKKIDTLMEENKGLRRRMKMTKEKALELELQCDQEDSRKELQQVKREASLTGKKLQNLQSDKEALLKRKWAKFVKLCKKTNNERSYRQKHDGESIKRQDHGLDTKPSDYFEGK